MNLNELEKDLRDFRPTHQEKINTDVLWDRVSPHIPQSKRKNRYLPFIILFLSIGLISVITATVLSDTKKEKESNRNDISLIENEKINSQKETITLSENTIADKNKIEINHKSISEINSSSQNNINNSKLNLADKSVPSEYNIDPEKSTKNETNFIVKSKKDDPEINRNTTSTFAEQTKAKSDILHNEYINRRTEIEVGSERPSENQESNSIIENFKTDYTSIKNESKELQSAKSVNKNAALSSTNKSIVETAKASELAISVIQNSGSNNVRQTLNVLNLMNSLKLFDIQNSKPSFVPKRINPYVYREHPKMSIEFGGSYLAPSRTLSLTNPEFSSELESRELAEEILEGWYASAAFRYNVTPRFGLSVGIQYGAINERSSKTLSYTETLFLEDTIVGNLVRVDGSIDPIYGDLEIDRTVMKNVSRINSYSFLQMPIELMYTQPINRLNIEFGLGIIQNISFKQTGFWHPDNRSEYDLSLDESGYLKSRLGISVTGRFGVGYDLTPGIGVYAHARYINHLSGITSSNYGIDQRYSLLGAEIGLRLHLFN